MSFPPTTISVKRKRGEAAPDTYILGSREKRQKSDGYSEQKASLEAPGFVWQKVLVKDGLRSENQDTSTPQRRRVFKTAAGNRAIPDAQSVVKTNQGKFPKTDTERIEDQDTQIKAEVDVPRKRPGARAGAALVKKPHTTAEGSRNNQGLSEDVLRKFEQFSVDVENEEVAKAKAAKDVKAAEKKAAQRVRIAEHTRPSMKHKPKAPKLRYKDRHPEKAVTLITDITNTEDHGDAMDLDEQDCHDGQDYGDEEPYVYEQYRLVERERDEYGNFPKLSGNIGFLDVDDEEREQWLSGYNGDNDSDHDFGTDDEDENAEDYFTNDYPDEDEGRHSHEFDDEFLSEPESDEGLAGNTNKFDDDDDNEEEEPMRLAAPKREALYWGRAHEQVGDFA